MSASANQATPSFEIRELLRVPPEQYDPELTSQALDLLRTNLEGEPDPETDHLIVAIGNGALLGAANAGIQSGMETYVYGIVTAEHARRQGVGSAIMQHIIDQTRQIGSTSVHLFPDNSDPTKNPRPFFESLGFVDVSSTPYSHDGLNAGRMILMLNNKVS
jgi:GNAT superfamily N-acetyltransferase